MDEWSPKDRLRGSETGGIFLLGELLLILLRSEFRPHRWLTGSYRYISVIVVLGTDREDCSL